VELVKKLSKIYTETINLVSLIDARILVTGTVTGKQYEFARAGTPVAVDIRDKDELLNKKRGRACCGGNSNSAIFQIAD